MMVSNYFQYLSESNSNSGCGNNSSSFGPYLLMLTSTARQSVYLKCGKQDCRDIESLRPSVSLLNKILSPKQVGIRPRPSTMDNTNRTRNCIIQNL